MTLSREELKAAYAEKASTIGKDRAFAQTIIDIIQPNHTSLDVFSSFLPTRHLNPGDNLTRRVVRGKYPIRQMVPGSMHLTDKTTVQDQYQYLFDRLIAGTAHNLWEIQSGDIGTIDEMKRELEADLVDEIVSRVFTLLGSVWNASDTPRNYADATSGGLTSTIVDTMVENVIDEAGKAKAIIGTRKALLPIYKFAGYKEYALGGTGVDAVGIPIFEKITEFSNTNRVSSYHGVPLIEMPNIRKHRLPGFVNKMLDTTKVIVVGDNAGEVVTYDTFQVQDYTDMRTQPATYNIHGWQSFAFTIFVAEYIGVIKVPGTSPY